MNVRPVMKNTLTVAASLAIVSIVTVTSTVAVTGVFAQGRLTPGTSRSHSGATTLNGPTFEAHTVDVTSGGNLEVSSLGIGEGCRGFVTTQPDYIVRLTEPAPRERIRFSISGGGDTTLVVHTPDGHWVCDDDSGNDVNPRIDIAEPGAGRYDVWVGSYRGDEFIRARLTITSR